MQQREHSTKTIFHERNELVLYFILSVMYGGYNNMNIRCNQKFMLCKDRGLR